MRRTFFTFAMVACATIATTSLTDDVEARPGGDAWKAELPVRQPWLRDYLPDDALVYARLPHLFGLLATPKGNALDAALRSEANVANVQRIRQGIVDNVLMHIPAFSDLRLRMLEEHLRSPLEIAAFFTPTPSVVVAANLGLDSNAAFEDVVATLGLETEGFGLVAPLDGDGVGQIQGAGAPVLLRFEADTGRLLVNAGPAVSPPSFANLLATLERRGAHPMRAMEARVDDSGQGLFVWIDAEQALPAMQMFVSPEQLAGLTELGLDKVSAAGLGLGVADGKGRLSLLVDMPTTGGRGFVPYVRNELDARSVGDPDGLMLLSIPSPEEFTRLEALALATAGGDPAADWLEWKDGIREYTGFTFEEILGAVGPDVAMIFDEAGDYAALRLRDAARWDRLVENVAAQSGGEPDSRRIGRHTYYHLSFPNDFALMDDESVGELGWAATLFRRQRDHLYWTRDDDYLYLSSIPQALIDRDRARADSDVGRWLRETQRIDARHAMLALTGTTRKLPQRLYGVYIEIMQMLADIAQVDIDVWSMPTVDELGLSEAGALGFTLSLGDPTLAAELTFENNPGEVLGGFGGIVTAGVLAGIAVPAYQDYTVRAKVSAGLTTAAGVKVAVTEHYQATGAFPGQADAAALSIEGPDQHVRSIDVEAGSGRIVISFVDGALPDGGVMVLEPEAAADGTISWSCGGTIAEKHMPAACRGNTVAVGQGL